MSETGEVIITTEGDQTGATQERRGPSLPFHEMTPENLAGLAESGNSGAIAAINKQIQEQEAFSHPEARSDDSASQQQIEAMEKEAEAEFKNRFEESSRAVKAGEKTVKQAAEEFGIHPKSLEKMLDLNNKLDAYKGSDAGSEERKAIVKALIEKCASYNPPWKSERVEAFITKIRPDLDEAQREEIVSSLREVEDTFADTPDAKLDPDEKADLEAQLDDIKEKESLMKKTPRERLEEFHVSLLYPAGEWVVKRMEKLEHWMKKPKEVWMQRGGKSLLMLLKVSFYALLWIMATMHKASGRGGGGGGGGH